MTRQDRLIYSISGSGPTLYPGLSGGSLVDRDAVAQSMRLRLWLAVGMSAYNDVIIAATTPPSRLS